MKYYSIPTYEVLLHTYLPMKMEQTECLEMSTYKIQTPGNYPEENTQQAILSLGGGLHFFAW